jgi:hypothetical protein
VFAKWVAQKIADREEHKAFVGFYERETGLKWDDRPNCDLDDPAWIACRAASNKFFETLDGDEDGDEDEPETWDKLSAELNPLAAEILSYNAITLEGLRLQLRALISAYNETWEPADLAGEEDPEHPWTRDFIESAAGVLGVPFPPF